MSGRKIGMVVNHWQAIPWKHDCRECISFASAPGAVHEQAPFMEAVWNHFYEYHHIEMLGEPDNDRVYRRTVQ